MSEGRTRASRVVETMYGAIREAHRMALEHGVPLIIHGPDGTIRRFFKLPRFPSMIVDALLGKRGGAGG